MPRQARYYWPPLSAARYVLRRVVNELPELQSRLQVNIIGAPGGWVRTPDSTGDLRVEVILNPEMLTLTTGTRTSVEAHFWSRIEPQVTEILTRLRQA